VGRMAPPDMIQQINSQYNPNLSYQQTKYTQQQQYQQPNTIVTCHTTEKSLPYYYEHFQYEQRPSVGTQYDPPPPTPPNQDQPPPTPNKDQPPPTPNKGQLSERSNGEQQPPPATPNSSNTK